MGINKFIAIGNLGKDPEVRQVNDNKLASFSIGISETFKQNGEKKTITEWVNCQAWGKLAEISEKYLEKGSQVYIEGKVTYRNWDDKDGNKRTTTEIIANVIRFVGAKQS